MHTAMHHDVADELSIHDCGITRVGAAMLGDWLTTNQSLTHLEYVLCHRWFDWSTMWPVVFFVFRAIKRSTFLNRGSIGYNDFGDDGLAAILKGLKKNIAVTSLA